MREAVGGWLEGDCDHEHSLPKIRLNKPIGISQPFSLRKKISGGTSFSSSAMLACIFRIFFLEKKTWNSWNLGI